MRRRVMFAATVGVVILLAGCGTSAAPRKPSARTGRLLVRTSGTAALAALPGGGLRFGELTGRIRDVRPDGTVRDVMRLPVATGGQRGLLGLAVDGRGRTYAAYVERQVPRRLVVERIGRGSRRLLWRGPPTRDLANGGHLELAPDGRLTIGIGDLQNPPAVRDPDAVNGKLLSLDPAGPAGQRPRVLSGGWNNPFAFTWTPGGTLWVADNSPGRRPERIGRGDPAGRDTPLRVLPGHNAPSGLAAIGERRFALCGVVSRRLERVDVGGGHAPRIAAPALATDCALGVVRLPGGRLAYATGTAIRVVDAP